MRRSPSSRPRCPCRCALRPPPRRSDLASEQSSDEVGRPGSGVASFRNGAWMFSFVPLTALEMAISRGPARAVWRRFGVRAEAAHRLARTGGSTRPVSVQPMGSTTPYHGLSPYGFTARGDARSGPARIYFIQRAPRNGHFYFRGPAVWRRFTFGVRAGVRAAGCTPSGRALGCAHGLCAGYFIYLRYLFF